VSDVNIFENPKVRKYLPFIIGGAVIIGAYFYLTSGSSASSSSAGSTGLDPQTLLALQQAGAQSAAQNAQIALAQQTEADNAANAAATLNAQINATGETNSISAMTAAGSAISGIIQAQDIIPATVINAVGGQNQAALTGAAQVAAASFSALPGVLEASYKPEEQYGAAVANSGSVQAINSFAAGVNTSEQASAAVATSAQQAAAQRSASNNSTWATVGTIAAIAVL
jgi:hypothetical protein